MKFVKERVNVICQELARLSISQKIKITDMQVKNGCYITPAAVSYTHLTLPTILLV